ncbi:MalY/PatB family protein [Faecalicoccus pleomorphus]|uniref:MalY/PatB family protein n=1 Tax=Faecalicoccus pleomorphus TaxID=1323 RepID=UPI0025A3F4B2|nr:MalY/PatB family protein [Faecalicoccus pleomorphus]MDM8291787.1 MalY/PatB family protein [Faecalicoccus pleomorphus]
MKYNFDEIIDRSKNHAAKYDERIKKFGTEDVIPLWIADMDFKTAQPIIDALESRAREGIWGYTSRNEAYFEAYADWQKKRHGWKPDIKNMSYALGVVPSLSAIVKLFTPSNSKVMIQTPVYPEFYDVIEAWDRTVIENRLVEENGNWSIDWKDFEEKASQVSLFILCSPHNPLGIVWERTDLERMFSICKKYSVPVVSDEIHSDLVFHGKKHIPSALVDPDVITCISCTKTFNLAGLQACTVVFSDAGQKEEFDRYWAKMDIHRNNAFSLIAMETALNEGEEWLDQLLVYLSDNIDFVVDYCREHIPSIKPMRPDATYLVWLDCRDLHLNQEELNTFFIQEARLGLNNGGDFERGLEGYMRLNVACPRSVLKQAMKQLEKAVNRRNERK